MSLSVSILKKYLNPIFVETGTYQGATVINARLAGFHKVISIEVSKLLCKKLRQTFITDHNIVIYNGDSAKILGLVIQEIREPITFFLDGHNLEFGGDIKDKSDLHSWPLVDELLAISNHPIKEHTILIDDVPLFEMFGTSIAQVKKILYQINASYNICINDYQKGRQMMVAGFN